jgi:SAM-dependent methyltransferase
MKFNGDIPNQERSWSRHAARYSDVFLDPYATDVVNPLWKALDEIRDAETKTAADLGCGTGPLLNPLLERFQRVVALDFAPGMIERARERVAEADRSRVTFLQRSMDDLADLAGTIDVAAAVNSLVMPDVRLVQRALEAVRASLRPGGVFLGIMPSIDSIQYHTMLLHDQALDHGMEPAEAERFASFHAEHRYYDFAFGRFKFRGLRQKFWHAFELEYRLSKAGFRSITLDKVLYPWEGNFSGGPELTHCPPSWDWFFRAEP